MNKLENERIHVVDALRGFALAGIVIVHMTEMYLAAVPSAEMQKILFSSPVDVFIDEVMYYGIWGKFFSLFSILFGLSFFIQMDSAARKGIDFKARFLWRLVILAGIGLMHRMFYAGDILLVYAVIGILLIPFYHASNKTVLVVAVLLFLGGGRYISFWIWGSSPVLAVTTIPDPQDYLNAITNGTFCDVVSAQMARLPGMVNFQVNGFTGRAYMTLGYFLLGMLIGRSQWMRDISLHQPKFRVIALTAFVSIVALVPVYNLSFEGAWGVFMISYDTWQSMFALTSYDLLNFAITLFIAFSFLQLFHLERPRKILAVLAPYGRMALTNYVMQSMIGTFIFFNWGLDMAGKLRMIECVGLALCVLAVQVAFSTYWLSKFKYGPLEWAWRSITYLKFQPFFKYDKLSVSSQA